MGTTNKMTIFVTVLLFIMGCLSCHDDNDNETLLPRSVHAMTLDDVRAAKITSLIGQEILLYENIDWDDAIGVAEVRYPYLLFKETDSRIEIFSSNLAIKLRENGRIELYYQGRALKRKKRYYLQGALHYSWRLIQPQPIDDPEFIDFVNDPIHWDDMFEFRLSGLSETPPQ